mgnify:FL=1
MSKSNRYIVYVLHLKKSIMNHAKFKKANPQYIEGKPCVYVGYTGKTLEQRIKEHREDLMNKKGTFTLSDKNGFVKKYYLYAAKRSFGNKEFYNNINEAENAEKATAEKLRKKGYGVWSN